MSQLPEILAFEMTAIELGVNYFLKLLALIGEPGKP